MKKILLITMLFSSFTLFAADENIKTIYITSLQKAPWITMNITTTDKGSSAEKSELDGDGKVLNVTKIANLDVEKVTNDKGDKSLIITYFDISGELYLFQCMNN